MKPQTVLLTILSLCVVFLTACNDSPTDVVKKHLEALLDGDLETANKYTTPNAQVFNSIAISMFSEKEEMKKEIQETLNSDFREEINGDTAKVYHNKTEKSTDLRKIDGKWKVDHKKD